MYREFVEHALGLASEVALDKFGHVSGRVKEGDPHQVLTEADSAIGKLLLGLVREEFPRHSLIDEEAGVLDNNSRYTWVIDPIDGTSNFAAGLPQYGIMIGLLEDATPIAGGIALPAFREIYSAEKGEGTTCNGVPVRVAAGGELGGRMLCYGIDADPDRPEVARAECELLAELLLAGPYKLRSSNSAFDVVMVASGRYGAFLNRTSKIWDNVAPHIVVEEAGGRWTAFDGSLIDYSSPVHQATRNFTHCGASQAVFQHIQAVIHQAQPA
ncbi:Inositol-1-monophosphatase [Nonomuraea coxensis DSM 45129]|uniref:Inositol-1-monophosphatase n=1 Tax=Nonomuraea coxensis DSM 45129 TaxID=1122611 RepID=A0ABX8TTN5_9ACTN|nr:inositol monophosphatase [Nonomuraea coxensis]QYC38835.1 Inositol-1-monophosphatase [Nonomuraea coxensis DSM 45129]